MLGKQDLYAMKISKNGDFCSSIRASDIYHVGRRNVFSKPIRPVLDIRYSH